VRVLYLVYWGACDPLGQALVIPACIRLAQLGVRLTLVTFEKPADLAQRDVVAELARKLQRDGISWTPLPYHKRPQLMAKPWDVLRGVGRGLAERLNGKIDVVHGRTFLGGVMGLVTARLLRARLIFHNEGFYPDEQVDGGVWRRGSLVHRTARAIEDGLYRRADGIIALSRRARTEISGRSGGAAPIIVVPSAVDLTRFRTSPANQYRDSGRLRLVYLGAIGLRYLFHEAVRFAIVALQEVGDVHLRVMTRTDPVAVREVLDETGLRPRYWSLTSLPHSDVPDELAKHDAGLSFLTRGISEHGCSPTKIGEYWASGLPVVTEERVGVVVRDHTEPAYREAVFQLRNLLSDPDTRDRCRRAAERHYGLEEACQRQVRLYTELMSG